MKIFNLSNYGGGTREMLEAASLDLKNNPGSELIIPPGDYIYTHPRAVEIRENIFSGVYGENPESIMFSPNFEAPVALDLTGCRNVTVSAYGAKLLIDGFMEPIRIKDAVGITVKGLTVDHTRKPFSVATVSSLTDKGAILDFDESTPPTENMTAPRSFIFDLKGDRITDRSRGWLRGEREKITPLKYRHCGNYTDEDVGNRIYFCHTFHARPGILISHSENTCLEDVTLHSQPGMGIVGFKSRNIHIKGLKIIPSEGFEMSVNTDATHFSSCSGSIVVENSEFSGQTDDSINVHNYYYTAENINGKECTVRTKTEHTHSAEIDNPSVGHILKLINWDDLTVLGEYRVVAVKEGFPSVITLDRELPADGGEYMFENATDVPSFVFRNCRVKNHLSRSVLCKTHNAVIEGNTFIGCTGTAVHIATEGAWGEGVPVENVTVKNNKFIHCGEFERGTVSDSSAVAVTADNGNDCNTVVHKNIVIEGNEIVNDNSPQYGITVRGTSGVTVKGNTFKGVSIPVGVYYSSDVSVEDNTQIGKEFTTKFEACASIRIKNNKSL